MRASLLSRLRPVLLGGILPLLALAGSASAQEETALLVVTVRSASNGRPVQGARVSVVGEQAAGVTDAAGVVRLAGVRLGVQAVEARRLGYATRFGMARLAAGEAAELTLALEVQAVRVAEIRVRAPERRRGPTYLERMGFERRRASGLGTFVTRADLERRNPRFLSDALRSVAGVVILPSRIGGGHATMGRTGGTRCPIQYFVDGVLIGPGFNVDDVMAGDVEGLEIYRGGAEVPAEFNRRSAMCGVIVIWTRTG